MKHQPKVKKTCEVCKKVFEMKACRARVKPGKFCSLECALIARRRPKVVFKCGTCGSELPPVTESKASKNKVGKFCSRKCYGEWRTKNLAGEDSPSWRGGVSHEYGRRYWKAQRKKAKDRDNHICQECGKIEGRIDVHHKKPADEFDDPKEAGGLDNLITLCRKCHAAEHCKMNPKPMVEKICEGCEEVFEVTETVARKKPCKFCSVECALKDRRKPKTLVKCDGCGKEMSLTPYKVENIKYRKFCSNKCYKECRVS